MSGLFENHIVGFPTRRLIFDFPIDYMYQDLRRHIAIDNCIEHTKLLIFDDLKLVCVGNFSYHVLFV